MAKKREWLKPRQPYMELAVSLSAICRMLYLFKVASMWLYSTLNDDRSPMRVEGRPRDFDSSKNETNRSRCGRDENPRGRGTARPGRRPRP